VAALMTLVGTPLVRAGRGAMVVRLATLWSAIFAATVVVMLGVFPGWMYAYFLPEAAVPPAAAAAPFFLAVVGAGWAGAFVTERLVRAGRMPGAIFCALAGMVLLVAIGIATSDAYLHVGTYAEYHAGLAPLARHVPAFTAWTAGVFVVQAVTGFGAAAYLLAAGLRARALGRIVPDAGPDDWRSILEGPRSAPPGAGIVDGAWIAGVRPADGVPLTPVEVTPPEDVRELLRRCRAAQHAWAHRPLRERARVLDRAKRSFLAAGERLAATIEEELGRPRAETYLAEIVPDADLFDYWCGRGPALLQPEGVAIDPLTFPSKRGVIERLPRGVVAVISPWNFPVALPLRAIVPALLAGNGVMFKPSEHAARTGALLVEALAAALPPDLLVLVQGGAAQGAAVIAAGPDALFFTGSPRTGRAVAELAARNLVPVALELGGKDAAIVLDDADLPRAARGVIWGAFANAGQNCAAIERCYVDRAVLPAFLERLEEEMGKLRVGPGGEGEVDLGPLSTPAQYAIVFAQLEEARARGARLIGGGAGPGLHLRPVLVVDPPADVAMLREETFGPVLPVIPVSGEEEAIRRANDSAYGLTASVWSRDLRRAERVARRIQAGVLTVNNHAFTGGLPQAPWSGVRGSGSGVVSSAAMLHELTRSRFVLVDGSRSRRELWWYPYDRALLRLGRALTRLRAGGPGRVRALAGVAAAFLARSRS
jgi:acyl-CoA reductase-like NAD-dependent aldehyde dehydrogenase